MSTIDQKHGEVDEELHIRSAKSPPPLTSNTRSVRRLEKYLSVEVTTSHADILLLICCLISGLVDSTIYNAYGTFVSMQTVITPLFLHLYPTSFSSLLLSEYSSS